MMNSPRMLSAGRLFSAAFLTSLSLHAAPLADFTSASYTSGTLSGQNGWSVMVQSPYNGTLTIASGTGLALGATTNGSGGPIAYWGPAFVFGASVAHTNAINFTMTESTETLAASARLVSLHFELSKNPYANGSPLSVTLNRIAGTSNYQMVLSGTAGGTVTGTSTLTVPGHALGLNFSSNHRTSDPLQLIYKLTRGATSSAWTVDAKLVNLATLNTFAFTANVTGATSYYSSSLYGGIHNVRTSLTNGGVGDGLSDFTISEFGPDPLSAGGVGTTGLASPWQSQDIGSVGLPGSASSSSGVFTVGGSGADIGGGTDAFRFLYQGIKGNFDLKARMVSQENTNSLAKAGLMVRNSLTPGSANAALVVTPGSGWILQNRASAGGGTTSVSTGGAGSAALPSWLRLVRNGNSINAYVSSDGASWQAAGSCTTTLGDTVYLGTAVTSHLAGVVSNAVFDNLSITIEPGLGAGPGGGTVPANATLTFSDDFSSGQLDSTKWVPFYCNPANINSELQVYLPEAISFPAGGGAHITASKPAAPVQGKNYVSGAMTTYGNFSQTYGYFEIKAQIPKGRGLWPAFWLLPDSHNWPPEIDVMENLGQDTYKIYTTLHWSGSGGAHLSDGVGSVGTDYSAGYHTYGVSWLPGEMIYYIDGVAVHTITGSQVPSTPMYMLVNLAVGGSWPGSPDAATPFPSTYKIAWVRAYQYNSAPSVPRNPIVFGPTSLSSDTVQPGATITVSSSVITGNTALAAPYLGMRVTGFWGTPNHTYTGKSLGLCAANSTTPFTVSYTVPATMAPGTYTIWYHLDGSGQAEDLYLAKRFTVVSPGSGTGGTLSPEADTYVRSGTYTSSNFGGDPLLVVKSDGSTSNYTREAFLRFDLSSATAPVSSAKLRLVPAANVAPVNTNLYFVASDTWAETSVNWTTKPAASTLLGLWAPMANTPVEIDVTSQVNAAISGDKKISFKLSTDSGSSDLTEYGSRENSDSTKRPTLILTP